MTDTEARITYRTKRDTGSQPSTVELRASGGVTIALAFNVSGLLAAYRVNGESITRLDLADIPTGLDRHLSADDRAMVREARRAALAA